MGFTTNMKYIVLKSGADDSEIPIIFSAKINHDDMHKALVRGQFSHLYPVGAGFISADGVVTTGHSETLNLKSRKEDQVLISRLMED